MLGFGGLLMVRSLFGTGQDKDLNQRFRLAREIFLVYAGIFGTIIGFYFGAADESGVENPPAIAYTATDAALTAQITGGVPPFVGYVSREGPPLDLLMDGNDRLLSLQFDAPEAGEREQLAQLMPIGAALEDFVATPTTSAEQIALVQRAQSFCPTGATITVVDGRGRRASADILPETVKEWAWPRCGAADQPTETPALGTSPDVGIEGAG